LKDLTRLVTAGRDPLRQHGIVNPPLYRASTVLFPTLEALEGARPGQGVYYGRYGTPTTFALEEAAAALEGEGARSVALGSGKAAITMTLLALLEPGDHLLMVDSVYHPTRACCDKLLGRLGIETTYYDPRIGAGIEGLMRPETRVVFLESPGSLTFEVQDTAAITEVARRRDVISVLDNTWATALLLKGLDHGVDVVIQAATKYVGGHADLMMGIVSAREPLWERLRPAIDQFGAPASPDDCWLALRGLRTLGVRLRQHEEAGLRVAAWLEGRPEVAEVLHPALPGFPDHALWKRDFAGASGLFGLVLRPCTRAGLAAMLDGMELFGMGYSWGGYESLLIPTDPARVRTATRWDRDGQTMRIHIGLEDPDDLIADLEAGFRRLHA
jgi:cysteine-S-conjugate beta-lyase